MPADRLDGDPQQVGTGRGRQGVGVRGPPQATRQEPPAEELPCLGTQPVQPSAPDQHGHHARCLAHHRLDPHAVAEVEPYRGEHPEPQQQGADRDIEAVPRRTGCRVVGELAAGRQLVPEGEVDSAVGEQVQVVPGLVAHAAPHGTGGNETDEEQQQCADRGLDHRRVVRHDRHGLRYDAQVRLCSVPVHDQHDMGDGQA